MLKKSGVATGLASPSLQTDVGYPESVMRSGDALDSMSPSFLGPLINRVIPWEALRTPTEWSGAPFHNWTNNELKRAHFLELWARSHSSFIIYRFRSERNDQRSRDKLPVRRKLAKIHLRHP